MLCCNGIKVFHQESYETPYLLLLVEPNLRQGRLKISKWLFSGQFSSRRLDNLQEFDRTLFSLISYGVSLIVGFSSWTFISTNLLDSSSRNRKVYKLSPITTL